MIGNPNVAARYFAMEFRDFSFLGMLGSSCRKTERHLFIRPAMAVRLPVNIVSARCRADSMCAPLVDPCCASYISSVLTRNSCTFRSGRRNCLADGQIGRSGALNGFSAELLLAHADARVIHDRGLMSPAGRLAVEQVLASTPFSKNVLLVSRLPLAQIGWLPKPALAPYRSEARR